MKDFERSMDSARTFRVDGKSAPEESPLGRIDQYVLVEKLGGGGFGVVYLAVDTVSGMDVAIKTLHPLLKMNPEEMATLREKFSLVARLAHPNIATALVLHPVRELDIRDKTAEAELSLSRGDSVMVMRYAPGVTLSQWRKQFPGGVVPPESAFEIIRQTASALDYAHSEHIVHRDIKPANLMVENLPDGKLQVRILDFGLAAEIRSSMSRVSADSQDTSGTRPYMAPEQWAGGKQDGRTDQYALACVAYELLSGAPPYAGAFESGDPEVMRLAVENRPFPPVEGLSKRTNAVLRRGLAKTAEGRFATCGDFAEALAGGNIGKVALGGKGRVAIWVGGALVLLAAIYGAVRGLGRQDGVSSEPSRFVAPVQFVGSLPSPSGKDAILQSFLDKKYTEAHTLAMQTDEKDPQVLYWVGRCLDSTEPGIQAGNVAKDDWTAKAWYEQAAGGGNAEAMNKLGEFCERGLGGEPDESAAESWYKKAGEAGLAQGRGNLARLSKQRETKAQAEREKREAEAKAERERQAWEKEKRQLWQMGYSIETDASGKERAVWRAGRPVPEHLHWLTAAGERMWVPEPGYVQVNPNDSPGSALRWQANMAFGSTVSGTEEGSWFRWVACSMCAGSKAITRGLSCSTCGGVGQQARTQSCGECKGTGKKDEMATCPRCGGQGGECMRCEGRGYVYTESICPKCAGRRQITVFVSCGTCRGTGQIPQTESCPQCKGAGGHWQRVK